MQGTITAKGQTTIPKAIRDKAGLKCGDKVKFFVHPNGSVVILPVRSADDLYGSLKQHGVRLSHEEEDAAIAEAAAERDRRSRE